MLDSYLFPVYFVHSPCLRTRRRYGVGTDLTRSWYVSGIFRLFYMLRYTDGGGG